MANIITDIQLSGITYQIQGDVTVDAALDSGSTNPVANSAITTALDDKQNTLVSGTNIKTINNESILGSGNIDIQGGSVTVDSALSPTSEDPVQNKVIYNKIDEVEQVTAAGLNAVNDKFDGLRLKKLTQTEYNNLQTKDPSTLYVIVD